MDTLTQARSGIASTSVPEAVQKRAQAELERWWSGEAFAAYRPALAHLVERGRYDELVDAFRQVLPFGTGGRRGSVGVGPNRMNPWTVGTSIQGHVDWLKGGSVVVAYDVRRFVDTRGLYGDVDSPIRGISSRDFAELAARVYSANGLEVWLLERGASHYLSTPELSFTIRALGAAGGVNISASHNPPDDNGVKVYDATGAQLAPPEDESLLEVVGRVDQVKSWSWEEAVASGRVRWLSPEVHARYVSAVASVVPQDLPLRPRSLGLLYTPLHGTGTVHEALAAAGFSCELHAPQAAPDGAFPTVPGGVANPEAPEAMAHALAAAGPHVQLVFGTDPDADRLGCEVRHGDRWVHLTGNEIAALVALATARAPSSDKRKPLVVITEVTSALVSRVAASCGAAVVDDLLVGFKYVAEGLRLLEQRGSWKGLDAKDVRFVAGAEESHGVLVTDQIRDKDAAGGAVVLASLAQSIQPRTLVDLLQDLRREHGEIRNEQVALKYEGASGQQRLAELLDGLRAEPPREIGGRAVLEAFDHRDERGRFGKYLSDSDRAARNVLVYRLAEGEGDEGARIILRPSGTEPKLKVYVEVLGRRGLSDQGVARVREQTDALCRAVKAWLL